MGTHLKNYNLNTLNIVIAILFSRILPAIEILIVHHNSSLLTPKTLISTNALRRFHESKFAK